MSFVSYCRAKVVNNSQYTTHKSQIFFLFCSFFPICLRFFSFLFSFLIILPTFAPPKSDFSLQKS